MSITTVLFDLDGTLLAMDQDIFIKKYFGLLAHNKAGADISQYPNGSFPELASFLNTL